EQAVCASWIGKFAEAFDVSRRLIANKAVPDSDRERIAGNRDIQVPLLLNSAGCYSEERARALSTGPRGDVTVSLVAGSSLGITELTLNTFLNSTNDLSRINRVLLLHAGLTIE